MVYSYKKLRGCEHKSPLISMKIFLPTNPKKYSRCEGLLDTGADATVVPAKYLKQIQARPIGEKEELDGVGDAHNTFPYLVGLEFHNYRNNKHIVYGWNKDFALIGRDLMKHFNIQFNGKENLFIFL